MSTVRSNPVSVEKHVLFRVGSQFWNIRVNFKRFAGLVDIGSHMSLIQLRNGNFLIINPIILTDHSRYEVDCLTENGTTIEAVIGVHPFHTLAFPAFYEIYPNAEYYGTPRHLKRLKQIPWTGSLDVCQIRRKWEPEVEMRIPAGAEFVNPLPESSNHFVSVFVFHRPSRTLHVDDTIVYGDHPSFLLKLIGFKHGTMAFHPSIKGSGLYPTVEAPSQFRLWMENILNDWNFDNICCAHSGVKIGGAHELVSQLVKAAESLFTKLSEKNGKKTATDDVSSDNQANLNVTDNECG
ncbi:unnamed protein product [Adineta ricciae]|uniref:Metallo-beta-lactamase domain-containing protein n=1 Tax=Adineta ricciae TaxID=249248 RepID=A0A814UVR8_ADIRI|nr:unnamed protein product [Adineta ricciae]CAF1179818.1 unnamed protein product [Adineta ricciae]